MAEKTEELIEDKAVVTKGIDTVTGDEDKKDIEEVSEIENIEVPEEPPKSKKEEEPIETDPIEEIDPPKEEFRKESLDFPTAINYREPKTRKELKESFISDVGSNLATKGTSNIQGFKGSIRTDVLDALYEPINLTEAIPDARERERFKTYNKDKIVDLFGDSVGITFQNDADDMFKFKEKQYHHLTKRFIDELDENEGFMEWGARTAASFIGSTLVATAGNLLGMVWGAGTSLLRWDSDYMFNNMVYDGLEYVQEGIDKNFVTYGGSDPYNSVYDEETGTWNFEQKGFVARFMSDPFKSINSDIVPAASFVASAVVSEIIASAFTAGTGGLAAASQAGLTARLAYRAGQIFNKAAKLNKLSKVNRLNKFSKANRILRGLDTAPGIKGAQINRMASTYRKGMGTLAFAFRTSAYESSLIARDTEEATLNKILTNYHIEKGGTITDEGIILDKDGNELKELIAPSALELEKFKETASSAATTAYFMNVPLVAGSHFIQFGNIFRKNYQIARKASTSVGSEARSIFNKTRLGGVRYKNGKWQANVDSNKWLKGLGYSGTILAKPITEGFEEFAQGGIQEGLVDYYAENYSSSSRRYMVGMLDSIVKRSAAYANTTEGQDSMTIGALMGLLGIRLPIRMNAQTGKYAFSLRGQAFGGSRQAYKQARQKVKDARKTAEILNSQGEVEYSPMLQQRLQNHVRYANSQGNKEEAAFENDTYTFKNEEHKQFVSGIYSRVKEGLGDTFSQEFEGLEKMSLEKFNELYGVKGEEFTEKTKKEAIEKAKKETQEVLDAIDLVENTLNEQAPDLLQKTFKKLTGKELFPGIKVDTNLLSEGFKEQMAYLYSAVQNASKREKELSQRINNLLDKEGGASLNLNALDDVVTEIVGLNLNTQKAEFRNNADKIKKEILSEWKKSNPNNFRLYNKEVSNLLDDILKLKIRKGEAAKMYESLFTEKGAEHFSNLQAALAKAAAKKDLENARKKVEEDVKKARNKGAMSNANAADFSVNGNNDITSQKVTKDVLKGIQEIEDLENIPNVSEEAKQKKLMQILDKNPGLLATIIERLEEKGISMKNVKTAKPIQLAGIETINLVLEEIEKLKLEVKEAIETGVFEADRNDQLDQTETASPEEIIEEAEQEGFKKSLSTSNWFTFVNITDKRGSYVKGEGYKFIRGNDGKYVKVDINGAELSDPNLLNSPDFLNTEYLENNPTYFEFRISNKEQEESSDKIDIDVIYKDPKTKKEIFIGRLFKANKNSPQQLKDLREEIVRREKTPADTTIKERANRIQEIKKEKEVIKKKLQENLDAKKEAPVADTPKALTGMHWYDYEGNPKSKKNWDKEVANFIKENPGLEKFEYNQKDTPAGDMFNVYFYSPAEAQAILDKNNILIDIESFLRKSEQTTFTGKYKDAIDQLYGTSPKPTQPTTEVTEETTVESKIKEVEKNKDFIKLSDNENNYVNTKTGKVYQRVSSFIAIVEITDKEYKDFVDNGIVSPIIINSIAEKIKTGIELTTQEQAIRKEKAKEIEKALKESSTLKSAQTIGTKVDELVRDFFADEEIDLSKYNVSSKEETQKFLEELQKIKDEMKENKEKVLSNDIVLYNDEIGVAGTVDLLTYDNKGVVRIYDMKTMKGNNFTESYAGDTVNKYETTEFGKSKKQKHTEQLSMYRMLLNNTHGLKAKELKIIPIEISYKGGDTTTSKLNLLENVELKPLDKIKNAELTLTKVDAEQTKLKSQLDDLNKELRDLAGDITIDYIPETGEKNIFVDIKTIEDTENRKLKKEKKKELEKSFEEKSINRANFINNNFQDIIAAIETSGIQIFLDPKTNKHKNC